MRKLWGIGALLVVVCAGLGALSGSLLVDSTPAHHAQAAIVHMHPWTAEQQNPAQTFPTSLHATRAGKRTWYSKGNGGFETLTGIPIEQVGCLTCHPGTYADGSQVDPKTYQPGCKDCHAGFDAAGKPTEKVSNAICLKCHARQRLEIANYSDVHREKMGKDVPCMTCHTQREMHGDGTAYKSWLDQGAMDASCENCHKTVPQTTAHLIPAHQQNVHCTACHTQSVVTCFNCHFESEVAAKIKRPYGVLKDYQLLVRRQPSGKVYAATFMALTYQGKSFVAIAPYRAHTITKQGKACQECHRGPAVQEYANTGKIVITKWDGSKIVGPKGVIPVPPDWKTALQFDFVDYKGDPAQPETDPTKWGFLKSGADLMQMLYAEPLTKEQIEKLKR